MGFKFKDKPSVPFISLTIGENEYKIRAGVNLIPALKKTASDCMNIGKIETPDDEQRVIKTMHNAVASIIGEENTTKIEADAGRPLDVWDYVELMEYINEEVINAVAKIRSDIKP